MGSDTNSATSADLTATEMPIATVTYDVEKQHQENVEVTTSTAEEPKAQAMTTTSPDNKNKDNDRLSSFKRRFMRKESGADANHKNSSNNNQGQQLLKIPPATKAPKETLKAVYAAGKYKAGLTLNVLAVQSFMAGIYIAAAGHLYLAVGGGVLGSALFPGGLIAVALTSAELFTGDALVFVAAVLGGQVSFRSLLRNWSVSWISNFVGSLFWAFFLAYFSGALEDSDAKELAIHVAEKKALNELHHIFIKAIGANFMVCVAVWQGTCAEEVAGKVLGLWFPTAAFVMMGFDHVVANMFLIPVGMMLGADVSVGRLFAALAMATMGNAIGGGFFVGAVYWYVFDSMTSYGSLSSRIRLTMRPVGRGFGESFRYVKSRRTGLSALPPHDEHPHEKDEHPDEEDGHPRPDESIFSV